MRVDGESHEKDLHEKVNITVLLRSGSGKANRIWSILSNYCNFEDSSPKEEEGFSHSLFALTHKQQQ